MGYLELILLIAQYGAPLVYMAIEYWLGKTDKIAAGSVVECIINIIKAILKKKV